MVAAKTHLSLNVRNLAESTGWYRQFFGTEPHKERPGYANFDLDRPALKLALNEIGEPVSPSGALNHLGILVDTREEVLAVRERLRDIGLEFASEDNEICCHAVQTKVWAKDPDGNMWEVYTIEDDRMEDDGIGVAPGVCCSR